MIEIRAERPGDEIAIRHLNEQAFGAPAEARLVDQLRAADRVVVSLVAVRDGAIVGHILFSPVTIAEAPPALRAVGLAPMCVLPEYQHQGIGSHLVHEGLAACQASGCDAVVVLGHVGFYPRFGFAKASNAGLDNEYGATDAFMVCELRPDALVGVHGLVIYAPEFRDVGGERPRSGDAT